MTAHNHTSRPRLALSIFTLPSRTASNTPGPCHRSSVDHHRYLSKRGDRRAYRRSRPRRASGMAVQLSPGSNPPQSLAQIVSRNEAASAPLLINAHVRNIEQPRRPPWRDVLTTDEYQTGMSQPANAPSSHPVTCAYHADVCKGES